MKIINTNQDKDHPGRIIIKEFKEENYEILNRILKELKLKRNFEMEKHLQRFILGGYKRTAELEFPKDLKKQKESIKKAKENYQKEIIDRIFENRNHQFQFIYDRRTNSLTGNWKSTKFTTEEFLSLLLSNNKP